MDKFKIGDKVVCISGFNASGGSPRNLTYGGAGYKDGYEFVINKINDADSKRPVLWEKGKTIGVYIDAVKLVSKELNYEIY